MDYLAAEMGVKDILIYSAMSSREREREKERETEIIERSRF